MKKCKNACSDLFKSFVYISVWLFVKWLSRHIKRNLWNRLDNAWLYNDPEINRNSINKI